MEAGKNWKCECKWCNRIYYTWPPEQLLAFNIGSYDYCSTRCKTEAEQYRESKKSQSSSDYRRSTDSTDYSSSSYSRSRSSGYSRPLHPLAGFIGLILLLGAVIMTIPMFRSTINGIPPFRGTFPNTPFPTNSNDWFQTIFLGLCPLPFGWLAALIGCFNMIPALIFIKICEALNLYDK